MALPTLLRKLFNNDGYGPELKPEILPGIIAAGATAPRYLSDRFSDIVNLKDFGAVGDGVTDDSTAWAAWKAALQNGGKPYIPAGEYLLGGELFHNPVGRFVANANVFTYVDDGIYTPEYANEIYVDVLTGDDSNNGLTHTTAVASINKAIEILSSTHAFVALNNVTNNTINDNFSSDLYIIEKYPISTTVIHVFGGTYTEKVVFNGIGCDILLHGNVVINGAIHFDNYTHVVIRAVNANYSLTVTGGISDNLTFAIFNYSSVTLLVPTVNLTSIKQSDGEPVVDIYNNSTLITFNTNTLNIYGENIVQGIRVRYCSFCSLYNVLIDGSDVGDGVYVYQHSLFYCGNSYKTTSGISGNGVRVGPQSSVLITGSECELHGRTFVAIDQKACVKIQSTDVKLIRSSDANPGLYATDDSLLNITAPNITIQYNSNSNRAVYATNRSAIFINATTKLTISGSVTTHLDANTLSYIFFHAGQISGSITGKRYYSHNLAVISTNGGGVNYIPGNAAGTTAQGGIYL